MNWNYLFDNVLQDPILPPKSPFQNQVHSVIEPPEKPKRKGRRGVQELFLGFFKNRSHKNRPNHLFTLFYTFSILLPPPLPSRDWTFTPWLCLFCLFSTLVCCQPTDLIGLFVLFSDFTPPWLVPLRQYSSSKFPSFYPPPQRFPMATCWLRQLGQVTRRTPKQPRWGIWYRFANHFAKGFTSVQKKIEILDKTLKTIDIFPVLFEPKWSLDFVHDWGGNYDVSLTSF